MYPAGAYLEFGEVKYILFQHLASVRRVTVRSPLTPQIDTVVSSDWAT